MYFKKIPANQIPLELESEVPQLLKYDVLIGWDTEYRNREYNSAIKTVNGNYNDVISYQYVAYARNINRYVENIIYRYNPKDKTFIGKLPLAELIKIILTDLGISSHQAKEKPLNILLVSHYSVAEYTTLKDRDLLDKKLSEVQKTLTSFKPFPLKINWDKRLVKVNISWKDTYLLGSDKQRSLADIALSMGRQKIDLENFNIENMVEVFEKKPELYANYALEDARIALFYYCTFMTKYHSVITEKLVSKEPITTSDGTVKYFLAWLEKQSTEVFQEDQKYLENKIFGIERAWRGILGKVALRKAEESIAGYSYLGGLNTFYRLGLAQCAESEIALDIDIRNAYPSAMASLPAVDWKLRPKTNFDLVEIAKIFNSAEINHAKIGIFLTEFNFQNIYQSSIAQKTEGGLIYTEKGEDFCTWAELTEAVRLLGVKDEKSIIRGSLYEELKINDKVYLPFAEYLKHLVEKRQKTKKGSFENLFYKLMANGFYGKLAQGIVYRTVYNLDGERIPLAPSKITSAHYASQTTGIIRAALEVIVNVLNEEPGWRVYSATTDGLVVIAPKPKDLRIKVGKDGVASFEKDFSEIWPKVSKKLEDFYPIKLINAGRKNLGLSNDWLEIKNIGDLIRTEQTRGNYISYQNTVQGIARANVSKKNIKNDKDFDYFINQKDPVEVELENMFGIHEIKTSGWDLTTKRVLDKKTGYWTAPKRFINIGYDGKRILTEDGKNSRMAKDLEEWQSYRYLVQRARKERRKINISEIMFQKENTKLLQIHGGRVKTIIRVFLTAAWRYQWFPTKSISEKKIASKLTEIGRSYDKWLSINKLDVKNWKRRDFKAKSIPGTEEAKKLVTEIAQKLSIEIDDKKMKKLLI